jgi:hypothetical protein
VKKHPLRNEHNTFVAREPDEQAVNSIGAPHRTTARRRRHDHHERTSAALADQRVNSHNRSANQKECQTEEDDDVHVEGDPYPQGRPRRELDLHTHRRQAGPPHRRAEGGRAEGNAAHRPPARTPAVGGWFRRAVAGVELVDGGTGSRLLSCDHGAWRKVGGGTRPPKEARDPQGATPRPDRRCDAKTAEPCRSGTKGHRIRVWTRRICPPPSPPAPDGAIAAAVGERGGGEEARGPGGDVPPSPSSRGRPVFFWDPRSGDGEREGRRMG